MCVWSDRQHHNVLWPPIQNSKEVSNNFSLQGEIKGGAAHILQKNRDLCLFFYLFRRSVFSVVQIAEEALFLCNISIFSVRERGNRTKQVCVYIIAGTDTLFNLEHVNTGTPLHLLLCKTIKAQPHISTNTSSLAIKHTPKQRQTGTRISIRH